MSERLLVGCFGRGGDPNALRAASGPGAESAVLRLGPLALRAAGLDANDPPGTARILCLLDGSLEGIDDLATALGRSAGAAPAQLLALGFERFGESVLGIATGSFLALFWDRERDSGVIARDPLGARPLFLAAKPGRLLFASEIRDLAAILPASPGVNDVALAHWLARSPAPGSSTLFEGIDRLPAGHLVRLEAGEASVRRWWQPAFAEPVRRGRDEAAEELGHEMEAATRRALGGGGRTGLLLSGGFDSAAIAGIAAGDHAGLRTYSRVFPDHPEVDESRQIALLRKKLGLPGIAEPFSAGSALEATARLLAEWSLPPASPNWFIWEGLMKRAAGEGIELLLDGEGGDEVFGCSPPLLADLLRDGRLRTFASTARRIPGMTRNPKPRWLVRAARDYGLRSALPPGLHRWARRARRKTRRAQPWLTDSTHRLLAASDRRDEWKELPGPRWWAALVNALVDGPDRLGAADQLRREAHMVGLRVAHPWRDLRLIEHVLSLPPELAFDPDLDRPLARAAMRGTLPDEVRLGTRKPYFNSLLEGALLGPDRKLVEALLLDPPDELAVHLRRTEVERLLARSGGPATSGWGMDVWRLAAASAWIRFLHDPAKPLLGMGPGSEAGCRNRVERL